MHTLVVAAPGQNSAGVLVNDQDLAIADDVVLVAVEELLGLDRIVEVADERSVKRFVEVINAQQILDALNTGLKNADGALLLIHLVINVAAHLAGHARELQVPFVGVALGGARDDERGTGLVDKNRVHLVDDDEVVPALHQILDLPGHVVAQVIEAKLVVCPVGDIRGILLAALLWRLTSEDTAGGETKEAMNTAHQLRLVRGQVVIHRDHVDALARQRVEVGRQRSHERLSFAGLHLRDVAQVKSRATHDLDIVRTQANRALRRLPHRRKSLWKQRIQGLPVRDPILEQLCLCPQLLVSEISDGLFEKIDLLRKTFQLPESASFSSSENFIEELSHGLELLLCGTFSTCTVQTIPILCEDEGWQTSVRFTKR